jgi:hypothetical protein
LSVLYICIYILANQLNNNNKIKNLNKENKIKSLYDDKLGDFNLIQKCAEDILDIIEEDEKFACLHHVFVNLIDMMTTKEKVKLIQFILDLQNERAMHNRPFYPASALSLLQLQSEEIDAGSEITDNSHNKIEGSEEQEVIVRYLDENPGTCVAHNEILDKTFYGDFVEDHSLSKYLARPQVISTITWAEGATLNTQIQPWDLFFNSTQNKKKLDNFARLSCNLHIKLILNASPFYYGAGLMSYQPLTLFTPSTISSTLTVNADAQITALSQRPHIWFYPQTCQGGEMILPFLSHRSWLDVNVRADFQNFGTLSLNSPTVLQNANSVVGAGVTIQVYAWASNVKICAPSQALALQAEDGIISGPASAVAKVAKALSAVPMIAPYARATDMIASGIGSLAKLFGFTNAPVTENVKPLKNLPFHAFSSCEISQPIEKLTMDPKNELSIDSRVCGHDGVDELLLSNFIQRESYVIQCTWASTHTTGQVLIRSNVCPDLKSVETHTVDFVSGTPMSHAASLFAFWKGDVIYRFRFICSKFHRGRVLIQWDPNSPITAAQDTNLIHSQIVDLSSETDVEFRVPYLSTVPFLQGQVTERNVGTSSLVNIASTGAINVMNKSIHNGRLILSVLTQQTSPVASADVQILVSVRAAENMTFAMPQGPPLNASFFALQSEEFDYDNTNSFGMTSKGPVLDDETFSICMGERITSLRQLLRRVELHRSWLISATPSATAFTYASSTHSALPLYFGYDPNGIDVADSTLTPGNNKAFNFVYSHFINWVVPCFVGYRGGINWHYNVDDTHFVNNARTLRLTRQSSLASDYKLVSTPPVGSSSQFARNVVTTRLSGGTAQAVSNVRSQAGICAYYPMYSNFRMRTTSIAATTLGSAQDFSDVDRCRIELSAQPHAATNPDVQVLDFYVSCGTDFAPIFFLNVPTYLNYGLTPAAV